MDRLDRSEIVRNCSTDWEVEGRKRGELKKVPTFLARALPETENGSRSTFREDGADS